MKGSLILLGGDPGVGKSTLLLQIAGTVASLSTPTVGIGMGPSTTPSSNNQEPLGPVWYVSGEETTEQIASRADRLGIVSSELFLLTETNVNILSEQVIQLIESAMPSADGSPPPSAPSLMVLDSIQTMMCDAGGSSASGGVTQVRECVALLLRLAKSTGIPIILIGHVTKKGDVAGPRTVEHMVDTVLYLEGTDSNALNLRLLRASKNRFGSNMAVGMYEMSDRLVPISDPSSLLLANRVTNKDSEGTAIALSMEGVRVMTVEVQALCTASSAQMGGRRTVEGIANNRLLLLLGILQKRKLFRIVLSAND
jgi:DNA repair protein RadA/Sms